MGRQDCDACDGDGAIYVTCEECEGEGYIDTEEKESGPPVISKAELEVLGQIPLITKVKAE